MHRILSIILIFFGVAGIALEPKGKVTFSPEGNRKFFTENGIRYEFFPEDADNFGHGYGFVYDKTSWYVVQLETDPYGSSKKEGRLLGEFRIKAGKPIIKSGQKETPFSPELKAKFISDVESGNLPRSILDPVIEGIKAEKLPGVSGRFGTLWVDGKPYTRFENGLYFPPGVSQPDHLYPLYEMGKHQRPKSEVTIKPNGELVLKDLMTHKEQPAPEKFAESIKKRIYEKLGELPPEEKSAIEFLKRIASPSLPLEFNLKEGTFPDIFIPGLTTRELQVRAMNDALNHLTFSKDPRPIPETPDGNDKLTIDTIPYFENWKRDYLLSRNPYACKNPTNQNIRLDWWIAETMFGNGKSYATLMDIPLNSKTYKNDYGVTLNDLNSPDSKNYFVPQSGVAHDERIIGVEPVKNFPGLNLHRSFDFSRIFDPIKKTWELVPGQKTVKESAHNPKSEAGEYIQDLPNGGFLFSAYLQNSPSSGVRVDYVETEFVNDTESGIGPGILNSISCRHCHSSGLRGADYVANKDEIVLPEAEFNKNLALKKEFKTYPEYVKKIHSLYDDARKYSAYVKERNAKYTSFLKASNAFVPTVGRPEDPYPLLVEIFKACKKPLSRKELSRELGCSETELITAVEEDPELKAYSDIKKETPRSQLERDYCKLQEAIERKRKAHKTPGLSPSQTH